jgi:hypothetical protein
MQFYDKLASSVLALADILDRDAPVMPEVVEDRQKAGGVTLWTGDFEVRDAALGKRGCVCWCHKDPRGGATAGGGTSAGTSVCVVSSSPFVPWPLFPVTLPVPLFHVTHPRTL